MTTIPSIEIFVRHGVDCEHRDDERWKRCRCRKHLRWTWQGRQYRQTAKTRSWEGAERAKREQELKYETAQLSKPADNNPKSVSEAITAFLAEKRGGKAAANTQAKYRLTLARLQEFCDRRNLRFIREIKLEHLSSWRAEWGNYYDSNFALRNNQSRVRHFFQYCHNAGMITENPAAKLSAIKITDDDYHIDPFSEEQYKAILAAIPNCDQMTPLNRARLAALMQLQRWSGLSLVDAVCLSKDEVVKNGEVYRVDTSRRKTGTRVNNVIPAWLGKQLLMLTKRNQYFFWTGESTTKSATSLYDKLYRKLFERAGIQNGGSHRLRHMLAISMLEAGGDMKLVSKAMGHKSLQVTERFYGRWSRGQQANLEKALAKIWPPDDALH